MPKRVTKTRDSGIELLRIIAVFMVIGVHLFAYSHYKNQSIEIGGIVESMSFGIRVLFMPCVNIFVIITGYFMVKMKFNLERAYKRVFKTYLIVLFYSIVLNMIFIILGQKYYIINGKTPTLLNIVLKMFFPILSQQWYFMTDYILLCLFAPFLNIILQNIKQKDYKILLCISTFVMSIWFLLSNLRGFDHIVSTNGFGDIQAGKNLFSFMYIYMIGGYIRLHCSKYESPKPLYLVGAFVCWIINVQLGNGILEFLELQDMVLKFSNPLIILSAVFLLLYFKDLHFQSKIVNTIASTSLGVYVIHEFVCVRNVIWSIFDFRKVDCSNMFFNIVYIFSIMIMVFGVCAALDLLRQKLFNLFKKKSKNSKSMSENNG